MTELRSVLMYGRVTVNADGKETETLVMATLDPEKGKAVWNNGVGRWKRSGLVVDGQVYILDENYPAPLEMDVKLKEVKR